MNDNEYGTYNGEMEFTSTNIPDPMFCANLPDEIFEHHIWKHFSFNQWIRVFSLVCKKWKRICEESTVDPKQIQIKYKRAFEIGRFMQIVKKYQPTILIAKLQCEDYTNNIFLVHRLCEASTRLQTLVLECTRLNLDMHVKPINNVTTLALKVYATNNFWQNLQIIFPNLKRLQIEQPNGPSQAFNIKVDHLTLIHKENSFLEKFKDLNPDVTVTRRDKMIRTKLLGSDSTNSRVLTYEEYFHYFGETELYTVLQRIEYRNNDRAKQLLRSNETTMEYERQLYDSRDLHYKYPSAISTPLFDSAQYWSAVIRHSESYDTLVQTNVIEAPAVEKFIALCKFRRKKEALAELSKLDDASLTEKLSMVRQSFFSYLLPLATKAELHRKKVIKNVRTIVQCETIKLDIEAKDFKKISDLRDWSDHYASTSNVKICHAMVAAGCKISRDDFKTLSEEEDVSVIVDLMAKKPPSNLVHALVYFPLENLRSVLDKHNISITVERNGKSLFNKRIRRQVSTEEELTEYKHLVNHMDSSGRTPLLVALHRPYLKSRVWPTVKKLLELGADPTKHRGDQLSPIGCVLAKSYLDLDKQVIDVMNLLIEYGADLNAPCLYKERMCSPLMIAVLNSVDLSIIRFLITMECRTDYVDETGRTIMDCAEANTYFYRKEITQLLKV